MIPAPEKPGRFGLSTGALLGLAIACSGVASATPTEQQIRAEVGEFQQFFLSRFPGVQTTDYQDGVAALPQFARKRLNRDLLKSFPVYETTLQRAAKRWQVPLPGGASLRDCFAGRPPASAYPYLRDDKLRTVVGDINDCLLEGGAEQLDPAGKAMAELEAVFKTPWAGQPIDIDIRSDLVRDTWQRGRNLFWAKRGQMNLSCANCHVHNAGNQLRGDVLSAALGHGAGFPAWSVDDLRPGGGMATLHSRYAACNALTGAAPFAAQSQEYIALELYQAVMNSGVPVKSPSLRQ